MSYNFENVDKAKVQIIIYFENVALEIEIEEDYYILAFISGLSNYKLNIVKNKYEELYTATFMAIQKEIDKFLNIGEEYYFFLTKYVCISNLPQIYNKTIERNKRPCGVLSYSGDGYVA